MSAFFQVLKQKEVMTGCEKKWRDLFIAGAQTAAGPNNNMRYAMPSFLRQVHAIKVIGFTTPYVYNNTPFDHLVVRCKEIFGDVLSNRDELQALFVLHPRDLAAASASSAAGAFEPLGLATVDVVPPRKFPTLTFEVFEWKNSTYIPIPGDVTLHLQILVEET